jgi:ring-1,2-phenylacetyl-CoA epoxidase subunit PaaD
VVRGGASAAATCGAPLLTREGAAWAALALVMDPEIPLVSIVDLGIVRGVRLLVPGEGGVNATSEPTIEVVLTPTYSGCPATEVIEAEVRRAIAAAGLGEARLVTQRAPAWTTDWITPQGLARLREAGIAPPSGAAPAGGGATIRIRPRHVACPRCGSSETERLAAFGSTACKALYRCLACREPFDHFKPF